MAPPVFMDGYFTTARSHEAWADGSTQIIVPSWGDPIAAAAETMRTRNVFAFVSAHHCFGNKPELWEACWKQTKDWMAPALATGRVVGVYVIDEPLGGEIGGITPAHVEAAIARVRADGFKTAMAEVYPVYNRIYRELGYRPSADFFGLTAYYGTKTDWVADRFREDPSLNLVFASSADDAEWEELARRVHARGLFRWSLDLGAASRDRLRRLP